MYVDDCRHSFEELASRVLPKRMTELREAITRPHPTALFCTDGQGPATIARRVGRDRDFSGCYVLLAGERPFYVGISRGVLGRIRQHLRGQTHYDASLVYAMAQRRRPTPGKRDAVMKDAAFREAFALTQADLRNRHVAFIQIDNPVELYVFEAFAALELGTWEWNTFRTH